MWPRWLWDPPLRLHSRYVQIPSGQIAEFTSHGVRVSTNASSGPVRLVLSVAEAAEVIGMGKTKFWELIWSGDLPHVRRGRWVGVPIDELREWIRKNTS